MSALESVGAAELRHYLRTPLNHIVGYGEMLLDEDCAVDHKATLSGLVQIAREIARCLQDECLQDECLQDEYGGENEPGPLGSEELSALRLYLAPLVRSLRENAAPLTDFANEDAAKIRSAIEALGDFVDGKPLAEATPSGTAEPRAEREGSAGDLLVIDDSAENRDILRRHLERHGYSVATASGGRQGLELLRAQPFDLILLDVLMPETDGFETLRLIQSDEALRSTPVVMISALDETNSVVRCVQMGAEDYLMKPFDPVLLSARIGASLEKKRLRDEERRHTAELQELLERLRRTQDQLVVQEKLASLGTLTAGIAHEIRNPLNFVTNFAEASRELIAEIRGLAPGAAETAPLLDRLDRCLGKIDEHGRRAERIVAGMLMHSRGKSGTPEPTDLKSLLTDALSLCRHSGDSSRHLSIETDFDPETGSVQAVPQELSRVFINLIGNAVYAVLEKREREGDAFHPRVWIRTRNLGDAVEAIVADNGGGIPPEIMPKIFLPFFTTKPAGLGTGLGLSLSHDIVVGRLGGDIRAVSQPGEGTEFIVKLPRGAV